MECEKSVMRLDQGPVLRLVSVEKRTPKLDSVNGPLYLLPQSIYARYRVSTPSFNDPVWDRLMLRCCLERWIVCDMETLAFLASCTYTSTIMHGLYIFPSYSPIQYP
jgi:hypothetical protein